MQWHLGNIVSKHHTGIKAVITCICAAVQNVTLACVDRQQFNTAKARYQCSLITHTLISAAKSD